MTKLGDLYPKKVFEYFEKLSAVPRGSGNMQRISEFCIEFAKENSLGYVCDEAKNVVIYKDASPGYENSETVILQGHLDMVCQKTQDCDIDFLNDGIDIYEENGFVRAKGTTLGADNGIAVAMIMALLTDDSIMHPPIEAVFTTDEEIGLIGASALDMSCLRGTRMINIDSEVEDVITVSCAGGSEFSATLPIEREVTTGNVLRVSVKGLLGGHSGVEIDKGRVNANILLARILNHACQNTDFRIADIVGGDKANAIPPFASALLVTENADSLSRVLLEYQSVIYNEISTREPGFVLEIETCGSKNMSVMTQETQTRLISMILCAPNGIMEMSMDISGLPETSLNLGILNTSDTSADICFALRSSKKSALGYLEDKLFLMCDAYGCMGKAFGHYPPWEYKKDSVLREVYSEILSRKLGKNAVIEAIHAGLECGVFAEGIEGLDCISVGTDMYDIHTVSERLSVSSVGRVYDVIKDVLKELK